MKHSLITIFLLYSLSITAQTPHSIASAYGNLDKDTAKEKVEVVDIDSVEERGFIRELRIFKKDNNEWKLWYSSGNAIMASGEGGVRGDPFQGIEIKKGILLIYHEGGSSWMWSHTHKYRFQNSDFYLIGVSNSFGKNGEHWETLDYNLLTGNAVVTLEDQAWGDNDEIIVTKKSTDNFNAKQNVLISLKDISIGNQSIFSPKTKGEYHF
ncbi:MAG: hypothetical protein ACKOXB_06360 [Flavobacteriales bacterium]